MKIVSINALLEALRSDTPINKVFINSKRKDNKISEIISLCREKKIPYLMVPQNALLRKAGPENQGVFAEISPVRFFSLKEVLENPVKDLILILDSINDTGNLGAIIRSCVAADIDGILISQRRSAPVNETVLKVSSGALLNSRIVPSKNLSRDIDVLKDAGYWIAGTTIGEGVPYYEYDFKMKTAIILGGEQKGLSPLLKKNADQFITIPHSNMVESLNVSTAAAVILFEALRQKI
ncbi:MAG: 23S rRNA (guanosine(2251)-2'-O)-methyltransferase RlmB [Acidobacteriota bacterium]